MYIYTHTHTHTHTPRRSVNLACGFCVEFSTARLPISTKTSRRGAYPGILHIVPIIYIRVINRKDDVKMHYFLNILNGYK